MFNVNFGSFRCDIYDRQGNLKVEMLLVEVISPRQCLDRASLEREIAMLCVCRQSTVSSKQSVRLVWL